MRQLNPTVKFSAILLAGLIVSFQNNLLLNLVLLGLFALITAVYLPILKWLRLWLWLSLAAVGVFFSGYFFLQEKTGGGQWAGWQLSAQTIYGLQLATRIYCFGFLGASFAATTTLTAFIESLQQQLHLPTQFAYGIMAAFHVAPLIPQEYRQTQLSLWSRGLSAPWLSTRLMTPLLVKSVRWSEVLATAMISRGFTAEAPRTHFKKYQVQWFDWLFFSGLIILTIILSIF
ncbi:energy-coupling factor transporter transmembrane component T [Lapidilactobacillus wuchangensis]|uniref:energy-coupling factor transporter transmembrane component T n=1 Tax=Lapidilactobacillus wuchangensis TaxID=2486001 RepID=UPI000F771005|nr:energy-coupling factor transporter transmembrane component T [Lapidilactobacillus wuchangensis]